MTVLVNDETMILAGLIRDDEYFRAVTPFLKNEYFTNESNKILYKVINTYIKKYNEHPNKTVLQKYISAGLASRSPEFIKEVLDVVDHITTLELPKTSQYMIDETEKFCKNQALFNAINKAIQIYDKNSDDKNSIPDLMKEALSVSFDVNVGHDYNMSEEQRWEYYTRVENKVPFELDFLNKITNNGVGKKTLNLLAAGVNVGKTMLLVFLAGMYMRMGYDVLYVTNEINEFELAQRIDATILNIDTDLIVTLGKEKYVNKFKTLRQTQQGRLFIKEFPTGTCSANGIRNVLRELELKQKFKPTIIMNDYLTLNKSDNISMGASTNTSVYFEKVTEELRALAMEEDIVMWSAVQLNKDGINSSDPDLTTIASSLGISKVADLIWAVLRSEMLDELGQIAFTQLKTRYHKTRYQKWNLGINIATQRIFEVEGNNDSENSNEDIKLDFTHKPKFNESENKNMNNNSNKKKITIV